MLFKGKMRAFQIKTGLMTNRKLELTTWWSHDVYQPRIVASKIFNDVILMTENIVNQFNGSEVHLQVGHQYGPISMLIPVPNPSNQTLTF